MEINSNLLKFQHPFTCMIAGPTSSGKTVLTRRILHHFNTVINFREKVEFLNVIWAYGQWQSLYTQPISNRVNCEYISGLPSESDIKQNKPHIIVIDDLMNELGNNQNLSNLFTKGSHHLNISVIFISQNMFHQGKHMRIIGLNCHYYLLMKNPRDKAQILHFAREVFPGKHKFMLEAYNDATSDKYGYLKVDLTQQTPDQYRVRSRITPEEISHLGVDFAPTIYMPK